MAEKFDVAVIGAGPGGYAAAIRCAQKGASVALAEKEHIGGTCMNSGCIPSKTLLASAHTLLAARTAGQLGIDIPSATPNWPKIQQRKNTIIENLRNGLTQLIKANKITLFNGRAILTAPHTIAISSPQPVTINADKIILATGSQPIELTSLPVDGQTVINSTHAISLEKIPASMVIVGGGVISCELACVYACLGTKVTIIEALPRIIPMEDEWIGKLLAREFKKLNIDVLTDRKVLSVDKSTSPAAITLSDNNTLHAEKVLVAVGRKPVCDSETIRNLGLQTKNGAIVVDEYLRTNIDGLFAVGDVIATTFLAHGAFAEAEVAAQNASGADKRITDYSLIPRAVYTFPEIASVGKNEMTCKAQAIDVTVGKAFFRANGRSIAHGETAGEIHVIKANSNNRIIGVTIVGPMATELISAARTLIGTTEQIIDISFPHPTVSEVLKEAAEDAFGLSLHLPPKK